jgi:hypothetical protein
MTNIYTPADNTDACNQNIFTVGGKYQDFMQVTYTVS